MTKVGRQPIALPYKVGDRIRLIHMSDDPDPIPDGTCGTVEEITNQLFMWQVWVKWDIPRTLALSVPPDIAEKINE